VVAQFFDDDNYSELEVALNFARKKKIGRFREDESRRAENRQKDLAALVRAGFDYDVAKTVLEDEN
jgi:regulatory protein